jgi:hypothetical protein
VFVLEKLLERSDFAPGFWNVNLPVLLPEQHELSFPITECQPEKQPLAFDFQMSPQEEVEGMATNYRMHAGDTTAASGSSRDRKVRTSIYASKGMQLVHVLGSVTFLLCKIFSP